MVFEKVGNGRDDYAPSAFSNFNLGIRRKSGIGFQPVIPCQYTGWKPLPLFTYYPKLMLDEDLAQPLRLTFSCIIS